MAWIELMPSAHTLEGSLEIICKYWQGKGTDTPTWEWMCEGELVVQERVSSLLDEKLIPPGGQENSSESEASVE